MVQQTIRCLVGKWVEVNGPHGLNVGPLRQITHSIMIRVTWNNQESFFKRFQLWALESKDFVTTPVWCILNALSIQTKRPDRQSPSPIIKVVFKFNEGPANNDIEGGIHDTLVLMNQQIDACHILCAQTPTIRPDNVGLVFSVVQAGEQLVHQNYTTISRKLSGPIRNKT